MTVIFPDILSDIQVKMPNEMQIVSSTRLPRIKLTIKGNRMIGPSTVQQTVKKSVGNPDIIQNFLKNSCMSGLEMTQKFKDL